MYKYLIVITLFILILVSPKLSFAVDPCPDPNTGTYGCICTDNSQCPPTGSTCDPDPSGVSLCSASSPNNPSGAESVLGKVEPPPALKDLGIGSIGISKFLNNLISLIYIVSSVVFVFILLSAAFDWLSSGGDKEKVAGAQRKLTAAIIGIVLFGVVFAILDLVGVFTGFSFFAH